MVADYLLFRLNNSSYLHKYPEILGLAQPSDDIYEVCMNLAKKHEFMYEKNSRIVRLANNGSSRGFDHEDYNLDKAAEFFIELYREGKLGRMTLDDCRLEALDDWLIKRST